MHPRTSDAATFPGAAEADADRASGRGRAQANCTRDYGHTPDKRGLRAHYRTLAGPDAQRDPVHEVRRAWLSARVALVARSLLHGRGRVGLYYPLAHEVDARPLAQALWQDGAALYLPKVAGYGRTARLDFLPYRPDTPLAQRTGGILEPAEGAPVPTASLDAIVVPGLAFDATCLRLGQGWGCYDRALADYPGLVVGLAHAAQMCPRLPAEPHDRRMHAVVTPFATYWAPTA